jgi:hypothetical protein
MTQFSDQYALQDPASAGGARVRSEDYGQNQIYISKTPTVALVADEVLNLIRLDTGANRLVFPLWYQKHGAFGASRTLDFGHRAYKMPDGTQVAENLTAFGTALAVATAGEGFTSAGLTSPQFTWLFQSQVVLTATVRGGTWPIGIALEMFLSVNRA